jgi:putative phosphoesterase
MKIGVLSDTHNDPQGILKAVEIFNQHKITTVIHCGDLTDPDLLYLLDGFRLIYAFGNMDTASGQIHSIVKDLGKENHAGLLFSGEIDGVKIAVLHSHQVGQLEELLRSREYEYIFHGHTHLRRDEMIMGTRVVNPGALIGSAEYPPGVCIVDPEKGSVEFIDLE